MHQAEVEAIYRKFGPSVLRRARAILGNEQAAKDVLQEIFVTLVSGDGGFRGESSMMTWLYQVTTHRCLKLLRDVSTRAHLVALHGEVTVGGTAHNPEQAAALRQLLARAPEELRAIAVYYYVDQLDHEQIAAVMNVSRRTIGNRLEQFRAFAKEEGAR